jgi:hypothetical protein
MEARRTRVGILKSARVGAVGVVRALDGFPPGLKDEGIPE